MSDPRKVGWQLPVRLGDAGFSKRIISAQEAKEIAGLEKKCFGEDNGLGKRRMVPPRGVLVAESEGKV